MGVSGGLRQWGEEVEVAAVREAREETGLEVRIDGLVNVYSYPGRAPVILVYAATIVGGAMHKGPSGDDECLEVRAFPVPEIPWEALAFRSTHEGLRDYLAGILHRPAGSGSETIRRVGD